MMFFDLHNWTQWDQSHYLDIAESGYKAFLCPPESGFNSGDWCGNAAWFPFFPLLISGLTKLSYNQINSVYIGLAISNSCFLLLLFHAMPLLSQDIGCKQKSQNILFRSLLFIFFPASIFFHANYPLAVALLAASYSLHFSYNKNPLASIPFSFLSCVSYPPMLALTFPLALCSLNIVFTRRSEQTKYHHVFYWTLCVITPLASYYFAQLYIDLNTGISHSFKLVGEKYGHGLHNPIYAFKSVLIRVSQFNEYASLQTVFLTVITIYLIVKLLMYFTTKNSSLSPDESISALKDLSLWLLSSLFIILPLVVGGAVSTYRTESLASLAFALMCDKYISSNLFRFLTLITSAALSISSLSLFWQGQLV